MNEITIHGNVTADPVLRYGRDPDTTAFLAFSPDGSDRLIRRHRLEASDIAVSLRWATATVRGGPARCANTRPGLGLPPD